MIFFIYVDVLRFICYLFCLWTCFACMYICETCACSTPMRQRKLFDALEFQLQRVVSHHVSAEKNIHWFNSWCVSLFLYPIYLFCHGVCYVPQQFGHSIPKICSKMSLGHMLHYVHSGIIYNSQVLESTQMSLNNKIDTENVVCLQNGILLSY